VHFLISKATSIPGFRFGTHNGLSYTFVARADGLFEVRSGETRYTCSTEERCAEYLCEKLGWSENDPQPDTSWLHPNPGVQCFNGAPDDIVHRSAETRRCRKTSRNNHE